MRHVSPCLPGRDRPRPRLAGVVQQWQCSRQGRRRQRGTRDVSGRSSCCLPANLVAATIYRVGGTTLFFGDRCFASVTIETLASQHHRPTSPPHASRRPPTRLPSQSGAGRTRDSAAETPETPGPKRGPQESAETARTTEGLPHSTTTRWHVLPPPRRRLGLIYKRESHPAQHK